MKKTEKEGQGILDLGKSTSAFLDPELGALLPCYTNEANSAQGLKASKLIKWNMIVAEGTQPPLLEIWTTDNEAELERLRRRILRWGTLRTVGWCN